MQIETNLTQIQPNVWRLVAPNPSQMTGQGTNTYFVGRKQMAIIDPGPNLPAHQKNIFAALQALDAEATAVIITHRHPDHAGGAPSLVKKLDIPLLEFGQPLRHGDAIEIGGTNLVVQHTPGHTHAHICLWLPEPRLIFAGDLVSGAGSVLIVPPDGDMAGYLDSLRAMWALEAAAILPGHGPVISAPQQILQFTIDHRLNREREVLHWYSTGCTTARKIAAKIYADRPDVLNIATLQVEAHLGKLRREGLLF